LQTPQIVANLQWKTKRPQGQRWHCISPDIAICHPLIPSSLDVIIPKQIQIHRHLQDLMDAIIAWTKIKAEFHQGSLLLMQCPKQGNQLGSNVDRENNVEKGKGRCLQIALLFLEALNDAVVVHAASQRQQGHRCSRGRLELVSFVATGEVTKESERQVKPAEELTVLCRQKLKWH
jgi:hypothetical protein